MFPDPTVAYLRDHRATAISTRERFAVVEPGGRTHQFDGVDATAAAALWERLAEPVTGEALSRLLERSPPAVRAMASRLIEVGIVHRGAPAELSPRPDGDTPAPERPCGRLVLGVTGAVHATLAPQYVNILLHRFAAHVDVVLTRAARKFVQPRALATLGAEVWTDPFARRGDVTVPHIHLASSADLVVILPASAACLSRLADAACSDLVSLVVMATEAPVVVVPSMNSVMWNKPAVRRLVDRLRADGLLVVEPTIGYETGERRADRGVGAGGVALDPDGLLSTLEAILRLARSTTARPDASPALRRS